MKKVLGDDLLSRARCTLPLAQERFTSEFGMGSGGTKPLWSPSKGEVKRVKGSELFCTAMLITSYLLRDYVMNLGLYDQAFESLVCVSSMCCHTSTSHLSTKWSTWALIS
jgi:hypothetical protein